ncbi:hypothetical protein CPC16_006854, partial [Podila verticillata]
IDDLFRGVVNLPKGEHPYVFECIQSKIIAFSGELLPPSREAIKKKAVPRSKIPQGIRVPMSMKINVLQCCKRPRNASSLASSERNMNANKNVSFGSKRNRDWRK